MALPTSLCLSRPIAQPRLRPTAARAALCDVYLQVEPPAQRQQLAAGPQRLTFARTQCPVAPPPRFDREPPSGPQDMLAQLLCAELIGACAIGGAGLGGSLAGEVAKRGRSRAARIDDVTLAVPGALAGTFAGLSVAGKILAQLAPQLVVIALG